MPSLATGCLVAIVATTAASNTDDRLTLLSLKFESAAVLAQSGYANYAAALAKHGYEKVVAAATTAPAAPGSPSAITTPATGSVPAGPFKTTHSLPAPPAPPAPPFPPDNTNECNCGRFAACFNRFGGDASAEKLTQADVKEFEGKNANGTMWFECYRTHPKCSERVCSAHYLNLRPATRKPIRESDDPDGIDPAMDTDDPDERRKPLRPIPKTPDLDADGHLNGDAPGHKEGSNWFDEIGIGNDHSFDKHGEPGDSRS